MGSVLLLAMLDAEFWPFLEVLQGTRKICQMQKRTDFAQSLVFSTHGYTMHRGGIRMFESAMVGENQTRRDTANSF